MKEYYYDEEENEIKINQDLTCKIPPITKSQSKKIISQMDQYICKIELGKSLGTGFFCKIPFPDQNQLLPVLITSNHVLKEDNLKVNNYIEIKLNDDKIKKNILIDKSRKILSDDNLDITILEIKPEDNINNKYLDIDENIFNENEFQKKIIKDKIIYSLQYSFGKESSYSIGNININFSEKCKYFFYHSCDTIEGSSGAPILLLSNLKVIGIHKENKKLSDNLGILIKFAIEEFNKKYMNLNNNIINSNDINTNILDNIEKLDCDIIDTTNISDDDNIYSNIIVENNINNINIHDDKNIFMNQTENIVNNQKKNNLVIFEYWDNFKDKLINGIGFLCKIDKTYDNDKIPIPVLITSNDVINDNYFNSYQLLNFTYFNENTKIEAFIDITIKRMIYQSKNFNITIIEIKEEDNIDINSFIEMDNTKNLIGQKIYLSYYKQKDNFITKELKGKIIEINAKTYSFKTSLSQEDLSGYPILNFDNNCVVGIIIKGGIFSKYKSQNSGYLLSGIIEKFFEEDYKIKDLFSSYDSMDLVYDIKTDYDIKIINNEFINRYNKVCIIIYNNMEYPLTEYFDLNNISFEDIIKRKIQITLKGLNSVKDMSNTFKDCTHLKKVFLSKTDMSKIISMESMFENCENLEEISDTSLWNVENIKSMERLFYSCKKLKSVPGINKWNPIDLETCYEMFGDCESLSVSEKEQVMKWGNVLKEIKDGAYKKSISNYFKLSYEVLDGVSNKLSGFFK